MDATRNDRVSMPDVARAMEIDERRSARIRGIVESVMRNVAIVPAREDDALKRRLERLENELLK